MKNEKNFNENPLEFFFVLCVCVFLFYLMKLICMSLSSVPTANAWAFAKWNAIQAVGVMSFGEFLMIQILMTEIMLLNHCRLTVCLANETVKQISKISFKFKDQLLYMSTFP